MKDTVKSIYIAPVTDVSEVVTEGFMTGSIHEVKAYIEVDAYDEKVEQNLDAL